MGQQRSGRVGTVGWPIVVAAAPTAAFQLPNLFVTPAVRLSLVVFGLVVLAGAVVVQVVRTRRSDAARAVAEENATGAGLEQSTAVRYAFGQIATRLVRFTELPRSERHGELSVVADRVAVALAFYLLPKVPRRPGQRVPAVHRSACARADRSRGAGDTAGVFRAGTPYGDRNLEWVLVGDHPGSSATARPTSTWTRTCRASNRATRRTSRW
ncbi:hypothetical protein QP157_16435 [Sphingomonas sp. LR61]|uniref:hypothetical protein n=1 Tax=Sphingomonas sp. LR61 TaxID=3050234 RepID=UPI002FE38B93